MSQDPRGVTRGGWGRAVVLGDTRAAGPTSLMKAARTLVLALFCLGLLGISVAPANAQNVATTVPPNDPTKPILGIAVNPTENYVYVTQGDGSLTILNAETNQVGASFAPGTTGSGGMVTYLNNVFVVNGSSNNVSVYFPVSPSGPNGSAFQQTFGDANAIQPTAIVVDPSGTGKLFVSNSGSNNVSVFTLNGGGNWAQVATLSVGANPQAMAINHVTHKVYVADLGDGKVWVIDAGTNTVLTSVNVGTTPRSIAINEVTNKIYVPGFGTNDLTVIDGATNTPQTVTGFGTGPSAVAVNPLKNQIFVANAGNADISGTVTVFNGVDNTFSSVSVATGAGASQAAIVVDPQTNIAYSSIKGGDVNAVNGGTLAVTALTTGTGANSAVALNPVTHKVYAAATDPLSGLSIVAVVDGAANATNTITTPSQPFAVTVNPATNKVYVANFAANNVSVIDGATNAISATVTTGTNPTALAIDPAQNLIYVANLNSDSVTIIDGASNATHTQAVGTPASPDSLAVNPVLRQVYGSASGQSVEFGFPSSFTPSGNSWGNSSASPIARATNPATGMAYAIFADSSMTIDDGAAPHSFNVGVCRNTGGPPTALDVNTQTNTVYVTCTGGEVDAIQGASGFFGGNQVAIQDPNAIKPAAVAVNAATNQIFVANAGTGDNGSVTIIDGTANDFVNIQVTGAPVAIAVNPATDKVYVQEQTAPAASAIVVIDGISQTTLTTISAGAAGNATSQVAVDPINGTVYGANRVAGNVISITENATRANGLATTIQPFSSNTTTTTIPSFTFQVTNSLDGAQPYVVYYQIDSQIGVWEFGGSIGSNTFFGTPSHTIAPGFHVVYAYAVNGAETGAYSSGGSAGNQHNPQVGAIASYGFLVAPPIAGVPFFPENFGSTPVNVATTTHEPILVNDGGAPMNFTYSIGGLNSADFQEVASNGDGPACSSLSGVLPSGTFCIVYLTFKPASTGTKNAVITFVDDSTGLSEMAQAVQLTGVGQAGGFVLTTNFTGNGTGSLSDGATFNCNAPGPCTHSYSSGATVTLTATAAGGSIFSGWSGACTGSGTCTVTMNAAQTVIAKFATAVASGCAPGDSIWIGGAAGNWSVAANWSTGVVPNGGAHVCINNAKSPVSSVTLDTNVSVGGLTIDPGNSLTVGNGFELNASGTISNAGLITVFASSANTFLTLNGAVTLTGGGTLTLNQVTSSGQPILRNSNNGSLTNVNNLIQGAGQFGNNGLVTVNQANGVINANSAQPLVFNNGGVTNLGLMEATAGGSLRTSVTIANKGGTIAASGSNSTTQFSAPTTIQGGTISGTGGGVIGSASSTILDGSTVAEGAITLLGTYTVSNGAETVLAGTITNTGVISLPANSANTFLTFSGAVTLTGGGTVTLTQGVSAGQPVLRNASNGILNNVNNLIQGSGQFGNNGLIINNLAGGVINANGAYPLQFNNGTVTNLGLIEATAGGTLQVYVLLINKNANLLATGAGSAVQFYAPTIIQGGTITSAAGGILGDLSATTLDGSTQGAITISGTYTVGNGTETVLAGTINNTGLISVPGNSANTFLTFSGPVTLTGGGTVTMAQGFSSGQPVLRNANNGILNNVNNLIQGSGQFGNNGLIINNLAGGVINANGVYPLLFNNGTVTNTGLVEATAGGTLQVYVLFINKNSNLLSTGSGSAVQFYAPSTIQGGTITSAAGGFLGDLSATTLDGLNQGAITISGTYTVGNGTETVLVGTINNTGLISVPANSANTFLTFSGAVTLTGSGTVTLAQGFSSGQPVLRNANNGVLNNVNNLIQGAGQFGNNGLIINNQVGGVINANGNYPLQFNSGTVTNLGLIEASAGGTLQVYVTFVNKSANLLSTGAGSAVQFYGPSTIQGGTITSAAGGFLGGLGTGSLDGATQGPITISGTYTVGNGTETFVAGTINNTGLISVVSNSANTFLTFSGTVTLTGGGTVTMNQLASSGQPVLRNANNGVINNINNLIQGAGQLGNNGLVVNNGASGVINANSAQTLQMSGATFTNQGLFIINNAPNPGAVATTGYTQTASGVYEAAIGGLTVGAQYSQLQNAGAATLAGALDIVLRNGFQPALGNQFTVLTSGAISGQFSGINSPTLPNGLIWSLSYTPTTAVLSVISGTGGSSTLTITDLGTGSGTVTDDLGLINCTTTGGVVSGTCSANYLTGSVVTLTGTPAGGSTFNGWSTCTGTAQCSVTLNGNQGVSATFVPTGSAFRLNVSLIGTGNGSVTDTSAQIDCISTAGVISGTCSGTYPSGTVVNLSASATQPSTFAGWLGACSGTGPCSVTMNSAQSVTASFVPPPQIITLPFPAGTNVDKMATYDCPSNPAPTPNNPCLDPNAHALDLGITQVTTPFTLTVQATEVPPNVADGVCPSGATPSQDFDCRFKSFFTYQTLGNGNTIVPLCYPYANGNCIHYTVFYQTPGTEPDPSWYTGPVNWTITWNNDHFVPPAPYTGSTPRLYDDPDGFVLPGSPYGTDCNTPMQTGNPGTPTSPAIFCQFVFDITTFYDPNKKVDAGIGGKTKVFNDVVVAIPPANAGFVTVTSTPDAATVTAGNPIGFTIAITNSSAGTANNATLNDALPGASGLNWSISPAYSGPGTCSITGATGAQVLNCSFGNVAPSTSFNIHVQSPSSSVGAVTNSATVVASNQQILSIASITVQALTATFSGLTPSQAISAGTSAVTLGGVVGNGNAFPAAGETVSVTINNVVHAATIGTGGAFSVSFPTATLPASATAYPITYSFAGDSLFGPVSNSSTALIVNPVVGSFTLTVSLIGTGSGSVFDNFQQIQCTETAGVATGTCSANYTAGTVVNLTASAAQPSTFAGWMGACTGGGGCSVTMNSSQAVTASFAPPPQIITLPFPVGTNVTEMATYDCPSNPNPTATNPCLDPNAHAIALGVAAVNTPFTLTVQATEVPPNVADGLCPAGATPTQDFDCRFKSFFTYQTRINGDAVVPLCYPYANGNCVHYNVFFQTPGTEPNPAWYTGPVDWTITWNNDHFVPPAPYTGSTPRLYDDPDGFVLPNSPYGTNCATPMQVGNPGTPTNPAIFCQFVFDITTFYDPNKKVDAGIGGKTKVFNDVVVAIPPATAGFVTVTSTPDAATVTAGSPIGFTIAIVNSSAATANAATLNDPLPAGTNVNWSITPAYAGPGTCAITGAVGAQVLNCTFGNVAPSASFSVHVRSASSSAGSYISAGSVTATNQQVLSIANITVQALATLNFSALTPSQTVTYGTTSVTLGGKLSSGNTFPAAGEKVTVTINGASQQATIGSGGSFTTACPLATIPAATTAYTITYAFAGDTNFGAVSDSSTRLTVTKANSTTAITANTPNPSAIGQAVTVTFTVSGVTKPTGTVKVLASTGENCTGTLAMGAGSCMLTFSTSGSRTITAAYNGDTNFNGGNSTAVTQVVNGAASTLVISPTSVDFGQVPVGFLGVKTVTVKNTGTAAVRISSIAIAHTGTFYQDFFDLELCPSSLPAGRTCIIFVSFFPNRDQAGAANTSLVITDSAAGSPQTVPLKATAINPRASLIPNALTFGTQKVGTTSAVKSVTVTNSGTTPLVLDSVSVNGDYSIASTTTCVAGLSITPGHNCRIDVKFSPRAKGQRFGAVIISDNALFNHQVVALSGQGN